MLHEHKFWMVKGAGPSTVHHASKEVAEAEAKRLARSAPGQVFVVLEAVSAHVKVDVESWDLSGHRPKRMVTSDLDIDRLEIPF